MVVTYLGNRLVHLARSEPAGDRRREIVLFIIFNIIGLALSVATLVVSHDLLGLTSRLADNISANVVGLALGTLFRYWSYKTFVFRAAGSARTATAPTSAHAADPRVRRRRTTDLEADRSPPGSVPTTPGPGSLDRWR